MEEKKHRQKSKQRDRKLLVILLILALLVGAAAAWRFFGGPTYSQRMEPNAIVGSMPGKSQEQIEAELTQQVKEKEVAFSINANPVFLTGADKGNILFENPKSNGKLTRVEITRDDTGELLYQSGLLEPGSYVPEANLLVDLEAGSYTCTATIYAYKLEDESYIGKVAAGLTVSVEG